MAVSGVFIWSGQSHARLLVVICGLKAEVAPCGLGVVKVGWSCESGARYVVVSDGESLDEVLGGLVVRRFWFPWGEVLPYHGVLRVLVLWNEVSPGASRCVVVGVWGVSASYGHSLGFADRAWIRYWHGVYGSESVALRA